MNKYVETLTVDNSVLALVDHQTGLLVSCRDMDPHLMTQNIKGLTSLAKTVNMPTVVTASMPDGPNGPVMPEITDILGDEIIERAGEINAWKSPEFKRAIAATGRKKIIMAGIVTDVCLMFPAISAVAEGYDVYAVVDASGTWNNTVMQAAMYRMSQAGVKVATWSSVLAEIMDDWRSEHGMELGEILAQHTTYRWVYNSYLSATNQK
ncbi:isochorismatase family protein [Microbulbifer sp. MLAF003]|uniref:isochorismatase family protein n=1 Tax=Microbulbifer sp. MLAF003 TaxID=3032582 RepID=UPI0024AD7F1C|nr:isochorismatase family protein [Microbulbifer sp. MLAF003]WHI50505.1 isochorismatase family protein [Microbulbifer sp. MLAF003]